MTLPSASPVSRLIPRDSTPVRIAVAGLGKMGSVHLQAVGSLRKGGAEIYYKSDLPRHIRRLELCGVCDADPGKELLYPGIPFYQSWGDLLRGQNPHLAIIASPTRTHVDLALQSLGAGVHTLVEKPITTTLSECQNLIELADANGCRVQAGHVERYNPVAIKLHSLLAKGDLRVRSYRFERSQPLPRRIPDDILTDKLIHDLDLAIYLFGSIQNVHPRSCREVAGRLMEVEVELAHQSGATGTLFVSWMVAEDAPRHRRVSVQSDNDGQIQGDFIEKQLWMNGRRLDCGVRGWISPTNNQIKDQLADFLAYCLEPVPGVPPPLLSRQEMLESIRIIETLRSTLCHV
jgi:predicted dehydrogenase